MAQTKPWSNWTLNSKHRNVREIHVQVLGSYSLTYTKGGIIWVVKVRNTQFLMASSAFYLQNINQMNTTSWHRRTIMPYSLILSSLKWVCVWWERYECLYTCRRNGVVQVENLGKNLHTYITTASFYASQDSVLIMFRGVDDNVHYLNKSKIYF